MRKAGHARHFDATKGIVISSYEFAGRKADELRSINWDQVVFDEAHRLRIVKSKKAR